MGRGTGHSGCSRSLKQVRALPADHAFQSLGSAGSLSSASTPKTYSFDPAPELIEKR
jgi:hypothetical protein